MDINLSKIMTDKLSEMESTGKVAEIAGLHIEKMVNSIFDNLTSYNSDTKKSLEAAIQGATKINTDQIGLPEYNQTVTTLIKTALSKIVTVDGLNKLDMAISEILGTDAPESIRLSEIVEKMVEIEGEDYRGELSFHHDLGEGRYGNFYVHFDLDKGKAKYRCKYKLLLSEKEEPLKIVSIEDEDISRKVKLGGHFGFNAFLFKLYASGTKIVPDVDDVRTNYYDD